MKQEQNLNINGLSFEQVADNVTTEALLMRPISEWRPILARECQVYVFEENYIAKRFDHVNYKFCEKDEAKEVLVDNLYALLRYKYFPASSEEVDKRIADIVSSVTSNLKTTLIRVSFDKNSDCDIMKMLPDYCVAFRNGVYNFKEDTWLFKYDIIPLPKICNKIYNYDPSWAIMWYLDYDFEPIGLNITETSLEEFIDVMKELTETSQNYCFELAYNISHNSVDQFSAARFQHLCEVMGYTLLQSFSQHFVFLIGSGQNGKNSLFDGCFTSRVIPRPAANDLDSIETDRFITGSLENRSHNIFLETSAKTYTESKMIKALTGSMYQTIESKGVSKYSGVINCKYIFAGNDQDKIKFSDTTVGFKRRINMLEIYYRWDEDKKFLKRGDYYDTTFSDNLSELKDDVLNTTVYVYLAMYGVLSGTNGYTKNFKFTTNDWNDRYAEIDFDLKERIDAITPEHIVAYTKISEKCYDECKALFYDSDKARLYTSKYLKALGYDGYDEMLELFHDPEACSNFFSDHDVYISVRLLQNIVKYTDKPAVFTQEFKKLYKINQFENIYNNKPYVRCTFRNGKLSFVI